MFDNIKNFFLRMVQSMVPKNTITKALGVKLRQSEAVTEAQQLWAAMYADRPPWSGKVRTLGLPGGIASELARLVTLEFKSTVSGSARADYIQAQYAVFLKTLREQVELAAAKGGIIFKPYISGSGVVVDCVQADNFWPVEFDNRGVMTAAVFAEQAVDGDVTYTRLEHHELGQDTYTIRNRAYSSRIKGSLGTEISLDSVPRWADLAPEIAFAGVDKPLFAYFAMPLANHIDAQSPLGVSVYSRAVGLIGEADKQYDRILWEYEGGELAVDASISLFKRDNKGNLKLPKGRERLFRTYNFEPTAEKTGLSTFSPALRDAPLFNGLNRLLQRIEFSVGFAYGTLSDPQTIEKTATEIKMSKQRSYALVSDTQANLQDALDALLYAMDVWVTLGGLAPTGAYNVSYEWDDSILTDVAAEQQVWLQEVSAGLMSGIEYRMRRYGETKEQAAKMLPAAADLFGDS